MPIEAATYISQLDPLAPLGSATKSEGDDELRQLKAVLQNTFPNLGAAAVTPTAAQLNTITAKANKAGETYSGAHDFTGATPTVPTASPGTADAGAASHAYVSAAMAALSATSADLTTVIVSGTSQTGAAGVRYILTNVAATTVTPPPSPTIGTRFGVVVANGLFTKSVIYVSDRIMSLPSNITLNLKYAAVEFVYVDATKGWVIK